MIMSLWVNQIQIYQVWVAKRHICKICHGYAKKPKVPCQTVVNEFFLENIPEELDCLNTPKILLFYLLIKYFFSKEWS